ncbi:hypothetical protein [Nonomuraea gerenzanensis]|nr:hypothetical protein [Nonomuraea gerenzanensis]
MTEIALVEKSMTTTMISAKVRWMTGPGWAHVTDEGQDLWKHA